MNPLNKNFKYAPFSKLKNEHFKPAILHALKLAREEIRQISSSAEEPDYNNTIESLEFSGRQLDLVTSIFFNLNSAETNDEIQKIAQELSPILTEYKNDIILDENLFNKVKSVYNNREKLNLNIEEQTLLEKKYKAFSRNGANLPDNKKN